MAPDDAEALGAIEKLIKKKLERVLVGGFEPNPGAVATIMGGESRGRGARESRGAREGREGREGRGGSRRDSRPPQQHSQAHAKPLHSAPQPSRPQPKPSDPIFSKPYEPGTGVPAVKPQESVLERAGKRRERPVAALLGGLKRA
jgi:ATP-dependent RNA helicase RhlE